jgi:hypothetical protein
MNENEFFEYYNILKMKLMLDHDSIVKCIVIRISKN